MPHEVVFWGNSLMKEKGGFGMAAVVFGSFLYLFKSTFKQMIEPLSKSIDRLSFNVEAQTTAIKEQKQRLEKVANQVSADMLSTIK